MKLFWPNKLTLDDALQDLTESNPLSPFHEEAIAFAHALSKRLLKMRNLPQLVALGYWMRKKNIEELKNEWLSENREKIIKPRGTVFHFAPSNVDTIFVYSWMLSLLAGNRNIIRISTKQQGDELVATILDELANTLFQNIAKRTIICTYEHDDKINEKLSAACHTRVIWGGDATIQAIRKIPLAPMANEIAFPDRFSLAVLSAAAVFALDENSLDDLAEQFYNDVYWFDQMACSSPRLVVWSGQQVEEAKYRFWSVFERKIHEKHYELTAAIQVLKYTTSLWLATDSQVRKAELGKEFTRIQYDGFPDIVRERHCGGGLFYEYEVDSLRQLSHVIIDKDQTIAYFGYNKDEVRLLVDEIATRGIDRIVPIGQALNFDDVWDGQSFLKSFTREVVII